MLKHRSSRFRTYFPDAYKVHYPNAKTHLSSRIRASLPDGKSLFEKTRSKKRRPFTEEEDRALKAGYEKHGTVWAAIVKDPIFQEQNRRSTDLRDRFRNAFPHLYEAAGYRPRPVAKKRRGEVHTPLRAATDDQLHPINLAGPSRRKRALTNEGLFRRGTKSVPQSTANSDDEESSADEDDAGSHVVQAIESQRAPQQECSSVKEIEMGHCDPTTGTTGSLSVSDFLTNSSQIRDTTESSQSQIWCPTPDTSQPWPVTNPGSPTSSQLSSSDFFPNNSYHRRGEGSQQMIGKSAWGQDWFSASPRLDPTFGSDSSYYEGLSPTPSSPFSFHAHSHGVVDRYDLFPMTFPHDFSSEVGLGDTHSTFSDPDMFSSSSFRGFTHHSNYAGDLIFGSRSHQPQQPFDHGVGFGSIGLGLSGVQQPSSASHSLQLSSSGLPGIDEIELAAITLSDNVDVAETPLPDGDSPAPSFIMPDVCQYDISPHTLEEFVGMSPPATPVLNSRSARQSASSSHSRSFSVPPSEHRAMVSTRQVINNNYAHTKFPTTPMLATSLFNDLPTLSHQSQDHLQAQQHSSMPPPPTTILGPNHVAQSFSYSLADALKSHSPYDLAFLDLHNYNSHAGHGVGIGHNGTISMAEFAIERRGRALDLASHCPSVSTANAMNAPSSSSTVVMSKAFSIPPSLTQRFPSYTQSQAYGLTSAPTDTDEIRVHSTTAHSSTTSSTSSHHRGLSAVSPQDLILNHGDNKRKRASWDGGGL
jgi:Myb-like DNA-binding domain